MAMTKKQKIHLGFGILGVVATAGIIYGVYNHNKNKDEKHSNFLSNDPHAGSKWVKCKLRKKVPAGSDLIYDCNL